MTTELRPEHRLSPNEETVLATAVTVGMGLLGVFSQGWREFVVQDMINDAARKGQVSTFDATLLRFWGPSVRREAHEFTQRALHGFRRQQELKATQREEIH